ncbi:signal recognition particle protein [Candidatus Methylacidithermus pantelleriae]|uniref:signal-recognition-particle GTPase n=1 Tax=Candidatus Methylacidithermus pantelleriae TaxID=2744239 RepID=A0A8J2FXB3_9BACT|nr:signal recognition particle receptor subunit alpha [Candidatus Methylacidithermus pantelleriae]CAF0704434.1 signal recognition particle protein component [Candidatus Methylacidithermus pantelleriae]
MLEVLQEKLASAFKRLRGYGLLTESNIADAVREVRMALLAADVHYAVAKELCESIRARALGQEVYRSVRPGDQFIKIFYEELTGFLRAGEKVLPTRRPLRILLCGLNGSGKTTTAVKLGVFFRKKHRDRTGLVAGDFSRPAAREQLKMLADAAGLPVYASGEAKDAVEMAQRALQQGGQDGMDVLILDSAGRPDVDPSLMDELSRVCRVWEPQEVWLVVDAALGQSSVKVAQRFAEAVPLSGVILTKCDGDAKGGALLSIHHVCKLPICFLGVGEKIGDLEPFLAARYVERLLGMGDVVALVERAKEEWDVERGQKLAERLKKGRFDLQDWLDQWRLIRRMGPLENWLGNFTGMGTMGSLSFDERELRRMEAMVLSMTPEERRHPEILNARRRQRIARGSGTTVTELNEFLRRFESLRKTLLEFSRNPKKAQSVLNRIGGRFFPGR